MDTCPIIEGAYTRGDEKLNSKRYFVGENGYTLQWDPTWYWHFRSIQANSWIRVDGDQGAGTVAARMPPASPSCP